MYVVEKKKVGVRVLALSASGKRINYDKYNDSFVVVCRAESKNVLVFD